MAEKSGGQPAKTKMVQYVGTADVRVITKKQWDNVGAKNQDETRWEAKNGFKVEASSLSKEAMEYIARDPGFKVIEA